MTWRIEFDPAAEKELKELGDDAAKDVLNFSLNVSPIKANHAVLEPL